jgi:hypothetical protein
MILRFVGELLLVAGLALWPAMAQQRIGSLAVTHRFPTEEFVQGIDPPIKCDTRGNVYFRASSATYENADFVVIRSDGERVPRIHWSSGEMLEATMGDFGVAESGAIYVIVDGTSKWMLEIGKSGEVKHQTKIVGKLEKIIVHDLAVLSSQAFLVAGSPPPYSASEDLLSIMNANGEFVRKVKLKHDLAVRDETLMDWRLRPSFVADDGNAYLLHTATSGAQVFVIAANGNVLRNLVVWAPAKGATPGSMFAVSEDKLALTFYKQDDGRDRHWYKVVDSKSGKELGTYEVVPDDLGEFVCYSSGVFEFLVANPQGKYDLVTAVPQE